MASDGLAGASARASFATSRANMAVTRDSSKHTPVIFAYSLVREGGLLWRRSSFRWCCGVVALSPTHDSMSFHAHEPFANPPYPTHSSPLINRPVQPITSLPSTSPNGPPAFPSTETFVTPSLAPAQVPLAAPAPIITTGPASMPPRNLFPTGPSIPYQPAGVTHPREEDPSAGVLQGQPAAKRQRHDQQHEYALSDPSQGRDKQC